jgi:hypothetical protein
MADVPAPRSPDSSSSPSTRQLLEELDDLMQRMLALPVKQGEEEPLAAPATNTVEPPKTLETVIPKASVDSPSQPRNVHLLQVPATRVTVHGPVAAPCDGTRSLPANSPPAQEVAARGMPTVKSPAPAPRPGREKTQGEAVAPTYVPAGAESLLPILLQHPSKAQQNAVTPTTPLLRKEPLPPVRAPWKQTLPTAPTAPGGPKKWLLAINGVFDGITGWLGPAGRWLRSEQGRSIVGLSGLAMIVVALLWAAILFLS